MNEWGRLGTISINLPALYSAVGSTAARRRSELVEGPVGGLLRGRLARLERGEVVLQAWRHVELEIEHTYPHDDELQRELLAELAPAKRLGGRHVLEYGVLPVLARLGRLLRLCELRLRLWPGLEDGPTAFEDAFDGHSNARARARRLQARELGEGGPEVLRVVEGVLGEERLRLVLRQPRLVGPVPDGAVDARPLQVRLERGVVGELREDRFRRAEALALPVAFPPRRIRDVARVLRAARGPRRHLRRSRVLTLLGF
mmetsp:Transcript_20681/g.71394  ORF Transcript_20681/g.71394 Transcript_20681/m.71394 type:complete len:258 (-) Transcript_20681:277-1050(-)